MQLTENDYALQCGQFNPKPRCFPIFDPLIIDFLDEVSRSIRSDLRAKAHTDVMSFAFWCRKANLTNLSKSYLDGRKSLGKGLAFHIAPSNVPVNFAYTFVFGLLSGCGNIVKIPSKHFDQVQIICDHFEKIMALETYHEIRNNNAVISFNPNSQVTGALSSICDLRVIWGGDQTINEVRKHPLKARTTELLFADRYSFAVVSEAFVSKLSDDSLRQYLNGFYNDTYLADQNACSSPQMIIWLADGPADAKHRFWRMMSEVVLKYDLAPIKAVDKFVALCTEVGTNTDLGDVTCYGNEVYTVELKRIQESMSCYRGKFGMFYEYRTSDFNELIPLLDEKVQTITYLGIDPEHLTNELIVSGITGVDRLVPFGRGLEIGLIWDGYDIVSTMSRRINIL